MTEKITAEIISLQEKISIRLEEIGYGDRLSAEHLSRQLASIAVLGKVFGQTTIPLFLSLNSQHSDALAQLTISIKCELEELSDAISDVDFDLRSLMEHLDRNKG